MLLPKKVKFRKWQTGRTDMSKVTPDTRGTTVSFGSFGLKAVSGGRIKSNQIESARKAASRALGKTGRMWIRIFPDRPFTAKPAEVGMGKGKGDPQGYCLDIRPGRIIFEVDGIPEKEAKESLRKAGTKLPVSTKVVAR
ncbi:TPA: 50S ribosomal protein L16 [Candidatus Nomurabacteria bacterium]|nr:MAG: 50S ribosomal protein L16 [Parcubacteria bacterium RAAC4_OD1_1]HCY26261.1 50S ribosomal protein L16 [Candidatus Nomurabacteria bacterium]